MFLTQERKPSFPIPKVTIDKGKDDNSNVKMDGKRSDSKSFGDEEDNLSYAVNTGDNSIHSDKEFSDDDKSDTSKHRRVDIIFLFQFFLPNVCTHTITSVISP